MNEKLRNQVAEMKKQTIGVEVEMNSITRSRAARVAAEFFGTGRYEDTARRNGYRTWSAWDAQGREWKFQRDGSIHGPDSEKCEMVTPILTYADMDLLQGLIRQLRKAGARSDATRGCGVHIHIGAKGHDAKSLRNLANIMASHERLLADALNLDRGRMSHYCKTVNPAFLDKLNRQKPATLADLAEVWYTCNSRRPPTTTRAATTCSTSTQPSPRARLSSGFSSSTPPRGAGKTASTPDSSRATSSSAWRSARWPRHSRAPAPSPSRTRTPSTPCGPGSCGWASSARSSPRRGTS